MANIPDEAKRQMELEKLLGKPLEELTQEEIGKLIPNEVAKWQRLGVHPAQIPHDIFAMDAMIMTFGDVLVEKGLVTREQLDRNYALRVYSKLQEVREGLEKEQTKSKILDGVHIKLPHDIPGMNGTNGGH